MNKKQVEESDAKWKASGQPGAMEICNVERKITPNTSLKQ
jgi:hypothetical protein